MGLFGAQVLGQRGVRQAAHAPEEVQLPLGHRQAHLVDVARERLIDARGRPREAAALEARVTVQGRQQVRALDAVLGACFLDTQGSRAQVAVVLQRGGDQPLQARIGEEIAPADFRGAAALAALHLGGRIALRRRREAGGHRRGRTVIVRRQRAARQHAGHQQQCGQCLGHVSFSPGLLPGARVPARAGWRCP
ncbi:hypothetical protein D3C87_1367960 [compost metagenome]